MKISIDSLEEMFIFGAFGDVLIKFFIEADN